MADRALQQLINGLSCLTGGDKRKHRIEMVEIGIDHIRCVRQRGVATRAGQITALEHLLCDQSLVFHSVLALNGKASEGKQAIVIDREAVAIGQNLPLAPQLQSDGGDLLPAALALHHVEGLEGGGGADALGPERAADETRLGGFHHGAATNGGGDGIAIPKSFTEHRHIRLYTIFEMQTTKRFAEAGRALIKDQHNAEAIAELTHAFQEAWTRWLRALHFHFHGSQFMAGGNGLELIEPVEAERLHRSSEGTGHAIWLQAWQQVFLQP